jgi:hypothetical protein
VAGELEARWNRALAHAAEVEGKIVIHDAATPAPFADPTSLGVLASNLKTVWDAPTTDARLKKRIVRTLIHEVVADSDDVASEIVLIVHWVGGVHSETRLSKRRRGQRNSTSANIIEAVRQLVLIATDDLIAGLLNRNGFKTGNGNRWTARACHLDALELSHPGVQARRGRDGALVKSQRRGKAPKDCAQDASASRRNRRDRSHPSAIGRPVDLCSHLADNNCRSIYRRTSATEPKKSAIQRRSGAGAAKERSSTFGATAAACRSPTSGGSRRRRGRALALQLRFPFEMCATRFSLVSASPE